MISMPIGYHWKLFLLHSVKLKHEKDVKVPEIDNMGNNLYQFLECTIAKKKVIEQLCLKNVHITESIREKKIALYICKQTKINKIK